MLRKPNLKTENDHCEKSHNAKKCERGGALGFLKLHFVGEYRKFEGGPLVTKN